MKIKLFMYLSAFILTNTVKAQTEKENIFLEPHVAMLEAYQNSKILAIGVSNHTTSWRFQLVNQLLDQIGSDPNLKYIVVEAYGDQAHLFEDISKSAISIDERISQTSENFKRSICNPEFSYVLSEFRQKILSINETRSELPILMTSIDGMNSQRDMYWPISLVQGDFSRFQVDFSKCQHSNVMPLYVGSDNRENDSAANFENLLKKLDTRDKIIVIYHIAHLVPEIEGCFPIMNQDNPPFHWRSDFRPYSWMQRVLQRNQFLRQDMKMIALDERDSVYNPNGIFKHLSPLADQTNLPRFAIRGMDLQKIGGAVSGYDIFQPNSYLINYAGKGRVLSFNYSNMFDYYIWESRFEEYKFPAAQESLPTICQ